VLLGSRVDVWQVIHTLRTHEGAVAATAAYRDQSEVKVRAAIRHYADFQDEVDDFAARATDAARREEEAFRRTSSAA
jgi:uncharacterized protein (DUF433 family)